MENNASKNKPLGTSSVAYAKPVLIMGSGNIVGQMENEGPLAGSFDKVSDDKNDIYLPEICSDKISQARLG